MTNRKLFAAFFVAIVLSFVFVQVPIKCVGEIPDTSKVLVFLRDVAKLDMAKYNVKSLIGPFVDYREDLAGLADVSGVYTLESGVNKIDVSFHFINNTLCMCLIDAIEGEAQYISPLPANTIDGAKAFMQRHQVFTGDTNLISMAQMLDMVDATQNVTKRNGNVNLEVTVTSTSVSFSWENAFNGAIFSSLSIGFRNNCFYGFSDDRSYMRIGSIDVNISKDPAISMALEKASDFWYNYGNQRNSNFTISKQYISAALYTASRNKSEPLVLYPYWQIKLPLDHMYPGFVTMIMVEIWADTSELSSIYVLGTGGDVSPSASSSASPEPSSSPTSQPSQEPSGQSSPTVSAAPVDSPQTSVSPSQSMQPSSSASSTAQPSESLSPTVQPSTSVLPTSQPTSRPEQTSDFPVQTAVAIVAVAAIVCIAASAAWFLRKRRT